MKIYTCIDHAGFWPVGVASVIIAQNEDEARRLLDGELSKKGLATSDKKPYTLQQIKGPVAKILNSGDY